MSTSGGAIVMISHALNIARSYFNFSSPVQGNNKDIVHKYPLKHIALSEGSSLPEALSYPLPEPPHSAYFAADQRKIVEEVLLHDDMYDVLGVSRADATDRALLRRAYLSRSKSCHPDKFPNNPFATQAFQKVSVAYNVLSNPASKRTYDSQCHTAKFDFFATRTPDYAEQTFRNVIFGVFNDFLDGDLEVIRTLLTAMNDIHPCLRFEDEGINSVITTLQSIREKALTCRACIYALHAELIRVIDVQHAFRQLSYFDIMGRLRLTIQLTRITLSLPIALEKAIQEREVVMRDDDNSGATTSTRTIILPQRVNTLIQSMDLALERVERILST